MIITLRNMGGMELDLDFPGPRGNIDLLPVCFLYDGRLFWKQGHPSVRYVEHFTDDLSRYTVLARRMPPGENARAVVDDPQPANHPSTDEPAELEVD